MRNNRLGVLPHELSSIPSLKNLYFSGNQAHAAPARHARRARPAAQLPAATCARSRASLVHVIERTSPRH